MSYRNIFPLLLALASAGVMRAQSYYDLQVTSQAYTDLDPAQVIGQGTAMEQGYTVRAPFAFSPYDSSFDFNTGSFIIARNGYFAVDNASQNVFVADACTGQYAPNDNTSAISVQLFGTTVGTRVMKLQWKNMHPINNAAGDYLNFQLWLFEADNSMEVHIGPSHLSGRATWNDSGPAVGMFVATNQLDRFYNQTYLKGDPSTPNASTSYDDVLKPLNTPPAEGTVYRFTRAHQGAGVEYLAGRSAVTISPNPATGPARIALPDELNGRPAALHLYDALGRETMTIENVTSGTTIPTGELPRGIYFVVVTSGARRYDAGRFMAQ